MPLAVTYGTDLSDHIEKLHQALEMTGRYWVTKNLPENVYARCDSFVIADWRKIWGESPDIPDSDMPILMSSKRLKDNPPQDAATYILATMTGWMTSTNAKRTNVAKKAQETHEAQAKRKLSEAERKNRRKLARMDVASNFIPIPTDSINAIRHLFLHDERFASDKRKMLTNVIRNIGDGQIAGMHFLLRYFRGRRVACVCSNLPDRHLEALKRWEAEKPKARALICDLPYPTDKLQTVYDLYTKLTERLDAMPKEKP